MRALLARLLPAAVGLGVVAGVMLLARAFLVPPASRPARELWLYQHVNLADSAAVARADPLWRRASAAGYSRIVLVDERFARLASQDSAYFGRLHELRALATSLGLEIVPGACLVGRAHSAMLAEDPNLAEALPVNEAAFEVRGGIAHPVAGPPVVLSSRPRRIGTGAQLTGGVLTLRGDARAAWTLTVAPWRSYHVAVKIRGRGFGGEPKIRITGEGRELAFALVPPPVGDSAQVRHVVFDSQENRRVTVGFALSRDAQGALEWSDWTLSETGPVNAVRRPGLEFRFDGLQEGRDFDPVIDPKLGHDGAPGVFSAWHEPPEIHVRRPDGTRLRGSWSMAGVVLHGQVCACLSDTAVLARLRDEVTRVRELFGARTVFLMHDEIRVIGQDATCLASGTSSARILAANLRACRGFAGDAQVCVWNDMFDPHHNAVDHFYLTRGSLAGSWEGLDRDVTVVNWNAGAPEASLRFFSHRGNPQVWAGYYDQPLGAMRRMLPLLDRTPRVTAIMYTTWQDRFDDLEAFAKLCRER